MFVLSSGIHVVAGEMLRPPAAVTLLTLVFMGLSSDGRGGWREIGKAFVPFSADVIGARVGSLQLVAKTAGGYEAGVLHSTRSGLKTTKRTSPNGGLYLLAPKCPS